MVYCCAFGCNNRLSADLRKSKGITFHGFPSEKYDNKRRKRWIASIRRKDFIPTSHSRVCSQHFLQNSFDRTGQTTRLRPDAVPILFDFIQKPVKTVRPAPKVRHQAQDDGASSSLSEISRTSTDGPQASSHFLLDHNYQVQRPEYIATEELTEPIHYSTPREQQLACPAQYYSLLRHTAMYKPHVCQRCSGTFMLASSLRIHAAHVHGEGLQAFLAENGCHLSRGYGNHGDTTGNIKPDEIKKEISGSDCEADNVGVSDIHCKNVADNHSGNYGDGTGGIKLDMIKVEIPDYEVDGVQCNTLATDKLAHVSGPRSKHYSYSNSSGTHLDTVCDVKPDVEKIKVCDYEVDSVQSDTSATDEQTCLKDVNCMSVAENNQLCLPSLRASVSEKESLTQTGNSICQHEASEKTAYTLLGSYSPECIHAGDKPYTCNILEKRIRRRGSTLQTREHIHCDTQHKPYVCNICEKSFTRFTYLKEHKRLDHTGDRRYACKVCEKSFTQFHHLKTHEHTHTGDKPYTCNIREKRIGRRCTLQTHEHIHCDTQHKTYVCNICKKSFTRFTYLKEHKRLDHTGDRPYTCKVCEKSFTQFHHLKTHEHIHTGEKPYVCDICEKSFIQLHYLKTHKRSHTGDKRYACNVCKKGFPRLNSLKRHERIHTGEKPYTCNICKKSFTQLNRLKEHEHIHTGEKPYACNVCKKSFRQRNNFKKHERIHTEKNLVPVTSAKKALPSFIT